MIDNYRSLLFVGAPLLEYGFQRVIIRSVGLFKFITKMSSCILKRKKGKKVRTERNEG